MQNIVLSHPVFVLTLFSIQKQRMCNKATVYTWLENVSTNLVLTIQYVTFYKLINVEKEGNEDYPQVH